MRKHKRLGKAESERLNVLFPDAVNLYRSGESPNYKHLAISVFDRWLSLDEAKNELGNLSKNKEIQYDRRLHEFCCSLATNNECFLIKMRGKRNNEVTYREFTDSQSCEECLEPTSYRCGSKGRFVLVFPEMELVYFEHWDFTHHVYFKDTEKLAGLKMQVKKHNVYILE